MNLPERFTQEMIALIGEEEYAEYEKSFENPRKYGLRVNTMKISVEDFKKICPFPITPIPWISNGFFYSEEEKPAKHPYYYAGLYYLQEPSAMTPANRLPIEEGDVVLDMCAAPGGKSTELAAKLHGTGILFSNDISASRAKALLKNVELFGVSNGCVISEDTAKLVSMYPEYFDKILIDAPCSGEGMFRKDAKLIKAWEQNGPEFYGAIQREIILYGADMLKPGGMMMYSTCTFSKYEDEETVAYLLKERPEMELVSIEGFDGAVRGFDGMEECIRLFPHKMDGEGHFLALLHKKGESVRSSEYATWQNRRVESFAKRVEEQSSRDGSKNKRGARIKTTEVDRNWKGALKGSKKAAKASDAGNELEQFLQSLHWKISTQEILNRISMVDGRVYLMPEGMKDYSNLHKLRVGLLLGEEKKNRFEPSQALAMALSKEDYELWIDLPSKDLLVTRYLKGETLDVNDFPETVTKPTKDGYYLICVDGFPLGWGKVSGDQVKNKYHAGWRMM
ncbi:MAG: RsmB/NOP family class I SAM-dependent RNA methyltransferase [Lachnospiraceae bacterium]|nr:RsmB/NOP family class I SAM-dependent RNA methyltransferase [Lachnospiraceae bacterium]